MTRLALADSAYTDTELKSEGTCSGDAANRQQRNSRSAKLQWRRQLRSKRIASSSHASFP